MKLDKTKKIARGTFPAIKKQKNAFVVLMFICFGAFIISQLEINARDYQEEKRKNALKIVTVPTPTMISPNKFISLTVNDKEFSPTVIELDREDKVDIRLTNTEGYHNFVVKQLGVISKNLVTNRMTHIYFVATQSGIFVFESATGKYEAPEPKGLLIVK